jgi:hypothetical protein
MFALNVGPHPRAGSAASRLRGAAGGSESQPRIIPTLPPTPKWSRVDDRPVVVPGGTILLDHIRPGIHYPTDRPSPASNEQQAMTRSGVFACVVICGVFVACRSGPPSPSGIPVFAEGRVSMTFTPQDQTFAEAAEAYRRLWVDEGSKIIEAMARGTGLTYLEKHVNAVIFEGVSVSGSGDRPMYLRASYPSDVKQAVLVHEHGHRLIAQLIVRPPDLDEHRVLDLFLYDVWTSLWGKDFADRQVAIESDRRGVYDYETAWKWALSLDKDQRASRFTAVVNANRR